MLIQIKHNVEASDRDNDREDRDKVLIDNNLKIEEFSKQTENTEMVTELQRQF